GRTVTWSSSNTSVATVSTSGLVSGVTPGSATITATSETKTGAAGITVTAPTGGSQFRHVFVVTEENTDYASVIGSSSMPYLNGLAQQYGLATQYYANTHPSIGNYFELATGQVISNNDSYSTIVTADNIVRQLLAAGKTWKSYADPGGAVPAGWVADRRVRRIGGRQHQRRRAHRMGGGESQVEAGVSVGHAVPAPE